jgi:anti-anti-sigma regulatory factor
MLRISAQFLGEVISIKLEGRLADQWAEELQKLAVRALGTHGRGVRLDVNLTEVTYIDHSGEDVLRWLSKLGAHFIANSTSSQWLCERVGLTHDTPVARS